MHRGRTVLAMDFALAGAEAHRGRPLNSIVRPQHGSIEANDSSRRTARSHSSLGVGGLARRLVHRALGWDAYSAR